MMSNGKVIRITHAIITVLYGQAAIMTRRDHTGQDPVDWWATAFGLNADVTGNAHVHASQSRMWGAPVVRGTRIPTHAILDLYREGISTEVIASEYYPSITLEQVEAALQFETSLNETPDKSFTIHPDAVFYTQDLQYAK